MLIGPQSLRLHDQGILMISGTLKSTDCDGDACTSPYDGRRKGYVYAVITAIACPCHLPVVGVVLGGTAGGAFFYENFWAIAVFMGLVTLTTFAKAVRILL